MVLREQGYQVGRGPGRQSRLWTAKYDRSLKGRSGTALRSVSSLGLRPSLDPPRPALMFAEPESSRRLESADRVETFFTSSRAPASPALPPLPPACGSAVRHELFRAPKR